MDINGAENRVQSFGSMADAASASPDCTPTTLTNSNEDEGVTEIELFFRSKGLHQKRRGAKILEVLRELYIETMQELAEFTTMETFTKTFPEPGLQLEVKRILANWGNQDSERSIPLPQTERSPIPSLSISPERQVVRSAVPQRMLSFTNVDQSAFNKGARSPGSRTTSFSALSFEVTPSSSRRESVVLPNENATQKRTLNLLLIGDTSVGKSSWINAFANYLKFQSLEDAINGEPVWLIPVSFPVIGEYGRRIGIVEVGNNEYRNERFSTGMSSTRMPKTYDFLLNERVAIKIIDTPGVSDSRGQEQDKHNFTSTIDHLANYKQIDAIVVMLKAGQTRLGVSVENCLRELLMHFNDNDAAKKVTFCFTHSKETSFQPGRAFELLQEFVSKNKRFGSEIPLSTENCFYFDNEAVPFLAAQKCFIQYGDLKEFSSSWLYSVQETERLFRYLQTMPQTKPTESLTSFEVRRLILSMAVPLAEIGTCIEMNLEQLESLLNTSSLEALQAAKAVTVTKRDFDLPKTVCTSTKCVLPEETGSKGLPGPPSEAIYRVCDEHCSLPHITANTYPNEALKNCSMFRNEAGTKSSSKVMSATLTCSKCGCSWRTHMHVRYILKEEECIVFGEVTDEDKKSMALDTLQAKIDGYREIQKMVRESSIKLEAFLRRYKMVTYNYGIADYLKDQIERRKNLRPSTLRNQALEKNLAEFEKEAALPCDQRLLSLKEVIEVIDNLRKHPMFGELMDSICAGEEKASADGSARSETRYRSLTSRTSLAQKVVEALTGRT